MLFKKKILNLSSLEKTFICDYKVHLKVGPITILLESGDKEFSSYIQHHYLKFQTEGPSEYHIKFFTNKNALRWERIETEDYIYDLVNFDELFFYRQHKHEKKLDILLPDTYKDWEIDNVLKLYFSGISLNHNILLLHASAIIKDGEAILFTGQSGAGKSTISGLSGYEVIHDDIIALSILEDDVFCLRTIPFKIKYESRAFTGKIKGFYRIYQNQKTYTEEINKQMQLMQILFSVWSFDTFKTASSKSKKDVLDYCTSISEHITVKNLYFSKTSDFLDLI